MPAKPINTDRLSLTPTRLLLLVAAFLVTSGNWSFFERVTDVYPLDSNNLGFLVSLVIFFYAFIVLLLLGFSLIMPVRIAATVFILLAAATGYYADSLSVVIDDTMVRNILQTNINEAADVINTGLILRVALLGLLPVAVIWLLPLQKASFLRELRYKLQTAAAAVLVIVLCILPLSDHYASFFREHKPLRYYSNPSYPIYSIGKYINQRIQSSITREFTRLAKTVTPAVPGKHPRLVILVVGETVRTDHFSLNGYKRETTPLLAKEPRVISYPRVSSCGTSTAISVPCMFAYEGREDFDPDAAEHTENILDILNR
ncbi:MAG TPA: phosphoethanolamine transferase, partial [Thiotrichales bacterium]|nr:phosphoethanolamine transferase [Thiotrichales bacterium]